MKKRKVHKRRKPKAEADKPVRKAATTLEVTKKVRQPLKPSGRDILLGKATSKPVGKLLPAVASTVSEKPKGVFVIKEEQPKDNAAEIEAELLSREDAFLDKVQKTQPAGRVEAKKTGGWSIFKNRFFSRAPAGKPASKTEQLSAQEIQNDSFLQRVQQKKKTAVVGQAIDESANALEELTSGGKMKKEEGQPEPLAPTKKEKGRILSAADLRKETKEAKEATARLEKEVQEIKKEMHIETKEKPEDKQGEAAREKELEQMEKARTKAGAKANGKKRGGLSAFFASIGHIGLGKERMHFVENMATMLNAGLPLIDSLRTMQLETKAKPMKKILQKILDAVENGSPLWRAMEAQSFFSLHALALVRIGEEAGNLSENMEYLAKQEEKDHELRSKVKMAMIYPSIVMTIMFIIVIGLGMFVLPNLIGVLYSLNVELPFITRMVVAFSNAFTQYGAVAVPASIGGFFGLIIVAKYTPLRVVFQWMMFKVPGIGSLAREATIARFGVILGGLLKAGVPVIEAMQSLVDVTPIVSYRKLYSKMQDHITIGDSFSKSFASIKGSQKLLPPSVQQLVITGEKSGALADIMLKIADIYDKKASETAQKLPVILEPMLLLFIGGLVGTIAFAIIVPIYSIVGNVGR